MNHSHNHQNTNNAARLTITIILNFVITIAELIGGIAAGSLSLISDAVHNFSDGIALLVSGIAFRIGRQPNTHRYTFGKKRAEILAAAVNAVVLVVICLYLMREAYHRFQNPEIPSGMLMVVVGGIGLIANFIGALLLRSQARQNLNFRAAYLHLLSDTVSSVGVVMGGIAIKLWSVSWIDPLITVLIALYVLWESFDILRQSTEIVMMAAPPSVSIGQVSSHIKSIPGVENVHHAHLWQMAEEAVHFEAHIHVSDMMVSDVEKIITVIEHDLQERFAISHVTIQCECGRCGTPTLIA